MTPPSLWQSAAPAITSFTPILSGRHNTTTYMRKLETLEERLMEDLLNTIGSEEDPVEQFRAMERYHKFVQARGERLRSEALCED